jgi:regulator of replication initiation timing
MDAAAAIERKLTSVGRDLRNLREELRVTEEELAHFRAEADDAHLRAAVSDRLEAARDDREAQRSVDAIDRQRAHLTGQIERLEQAQDELLDQLADVRRGV